MKKTILITGLVLASSNAIANQTTIYCGNTIDVQASQVTNGKTLTIKDGKIDNVADGKSENVDIDLSDKTCLPGLIDMHVHLTSQSNPQSYSEGFRLNATDFAFRSAKYAKITLEAGFTTVRNLGDDQTHAFLFAEAPRILFPFARRVIADAVRDAGFAPLMIDPIDFNGLYLQQLARKQQEEAAAGGVQPPAGDG